MSTPCQTQGLDAEWKPEERRRDGRQDRQDVVNPVQPLGKTTGSNRLAASSADVIMAIAQQHTTTTTLTTSTMD